MDLVGLAGKVRSALHKKVVLATLAGGLAFSTVYAFAATLGVTSNTLGAGNSAVTTCTSSVNASYTVAYDSTITGYRVSGVNINSLIAACVDKTITVSLTDSGNASLFETTPYVILSADATAGNKTLPVTGDIPAADVTGVSVVITG